MNPVSPHSGGTALIGSIPISDIRPNPFQPRRAFDKAELAELEASLLKNGLLQPITVRSNPAEGGFELIAGERRLKAAAAIGWTEIQALVREVDDKTLLTLALVENLQRADLNPMEEAEGYRRLIQEFGATQRQVAEVVGKDRVSVSNALRLLNLPAAVRDLISRGKITPGHARPLLGLPDEKQMLALAEQIVTGQLSVREVERRVTVEVPGRRRGSKKAKHPSTPLAPAQLEIRGIEDELREYLQTDAKLHITGADRGTLSISFYSAEDLERILERIGARREHR